MKITIAYDLDEIDMHDSVVERIKAILPRYRVHISGTKNGFYHTYVTCKKSEKPLDSTEFD